MVIHFSGPKEVALNLSKGLHEALLNAGQGGEIEYRRGRMESYTDAALSDGGFFRFLKECDTFATTAYPDVLSETPKQWFSLLDVAKGDGKFFGQAFKREQLEKGINLFIQNLSQLFEFKFQGPSNVPDYALGKLETLATMLKESVPKTN